MGPEAKLERKVVALCKQHEVICYKFVSPNHAGVPDRILVFPNGAVAFVELKAPGGRLTALQQYEIARLRKQGATVVVHNDYAEFTDWFTALRTMI